jgi:hypothetical protein
MKMKGDTFLVQGKYGNRNFGFGIMVADINPFTADHALSSSEILPLLESRRLGSHEACVLHADLGMITEFLIGTGNIHASGRLLGKLRDIYSKTVVISNDFYKFAYKVTNIFGTFIEVDSDNKVSIYRGGRLVRTIRDAARRSQRFAVRNSCLSAVPEIFGDIPEKQQVNDTDLDNLPPYPLNMGLRCLSDSGSEAVLGVKAIRTILRTKEAVRRGGKHNPVFAT